MIQVKYILLFLLLFVLLFNSGFSLQINRLEGSKPLKTQWLSDKRVLLITNGPHLFISNDGGETWTSEQQHFPCSATQNNASCISRVFTSHQFHPYFILAETSTMEYFVTLDQGQSFRSLAFPSPLDSDNRFQDSSPSISIDAEKSLDASFQLNPTDPYRAWARIQDGRYVVTKNISGHNFSPDWIDIEPIMFSNNNNENNENNENLKNTIVHVSWLMAPNSPEYTSDSLLVLHRQTEKSTGEESYILSRVSMFKNYADSSDHRYQVIAENVVDFSYINGYLFIATRQNSNNDHSLLLNLHVSTDNGVHTRVVDERRYYYSQRSLNDKDPTHMKIEDMMFLDVSSGGVLSAVTNDTLSPWTQVFLSNGRGTRFRPILENLRRVANGAVDFFPISSVDGTYLANVIDSPASVDSLCRDCIESQSSCQELCPVKTQISIDGGNTWQSLQLDPQECDATTSNCSLGLQGIVSTYPSPFYAPPTTYGIATALGNAEGTYLKNDRIPETFLTRDGGMTWRRIASTSSITAMAVHGEVMLMAESGVDPIQTVQYSLDSGDSWEDIRLNSTEVGSFDQFHVLNIESEPNNMNPSFIIYFKPELNSIDDSIWVAFIDLSSFVSRKCDIPSNLDLNQNDSPDYEQFVPRIFKYINNNNNNENNNNNNNKCWMGKKMSYLRRKSNTSCISSKSLDQKSMIHIEPCSCTINDYECDIGYEWHSSSSTCHQVYNATEPSPEHCTDTYIVSRGYRHIRDNACQGGVDLSPYTRKCPSPNNHGDSDENHSGEERSGDENENQQGMGPFTLVFLFIVLFLVLFGLFTLTGVFIYKNNAAINRSLEDAFPQFARIRYSLLQNTNTRGGSGIDDDVNDDNNGDDDQGGTVFGLDDLGNNVEMAERDNDGEEDDNNEPLDV